MAKILRTRLIIRFLATIALILFSLRCLADGPVNQSFLDLVAQVQKAQQACPKATDGTYDPSCIIKLGPMYVALVDDTSTDQPIDSLNALASVLQDQRQRFQDIKLFIWKNLALLIAGKTAITDCLLQNALSSTASACAAASSLPAPQPPASPGATALSGTSASTAAATPASASGSGKPPAKTSCSGATAGAQLKTKTTLNNNIDADGKFSGTSDAAGSVRICLNDTVVAEIPVDSYGKFEGGTPATTKVDSGDKFVAQATDDTNYGPLSNEVTVGTCAKMGTGDPSAKPVLNAARAGDTKVSGTLANPDDAKKVTVRVCVDDREVAAPPLASKGQFSATLSSPLAQGQSVSAQQIVPATASKPATYGLASTIQVGAQGSDSNKAVAILIGGAEYAGYSAQAQTTDGFLNIFYQGPISPGGLGGWARIRLTSAPQQATNGVVSVISNPTGLTTYNYSNVGQVLDYVIGPSWKISSGWSIIGGFGAITPLSSQNVPVTFVAPGPGTNECSELVSRFSAKNGYQPALSLNTAKNPTSCLAGGYTDIAFSNQDRSNFLMKYGAGVRTWYPFGGCKDGGSGSSCSTAYAAVDATLGQDSSVTEGYLRGLVFKLDGILPIPTGSSSWLYLFGSTYTRLQRNQDLPPLILATPNPPVAVPLPSVIVLPLRQPNRDYYRLGVGLNINQLWCKAFGSGCTNSSQDAGSTNPAPAIKLAPTSGSVGTPVTITGVSLTQTTKVTFGGVAATKFSVNSDTEVTATVPTGAKTGKIAITTAGGVATSSGVFTVTQ